mmetsp:Transcript_13321/g.18435  ORF Transcript_13321/g.18435 Transcript_13321/m.18435 type:complete len:96 (+) Transcript_13321:415-702(+)
MRLCSDFGARIRQRETPNSRKWRTFTKCSQNLRIYGTGPLRNSEIRFPPLGSKARARSLLAEAGCAKECGIILFMFKRQRDKHHPDAIAMRAFNE